MKIERTKNSLMGITSGIINKVILLLLNFLVKRIFIKNLGIDYFGLNNLFSNILNILNLAELGIGSALTFSMYSSIGKNNKKVCELENFYKKSYKIIGFSILLIGLLLIPFIKFICNGNIPNDVNIYIIYLLFLFNIFINYILLSYKLSILNAYQQSYIINNTNTIVNIIIYILQIIVLVYKRNYYLYIILIVIGTIINNLILSFYVDKKYPQYKPKGNLAKSDKKKLFTKIKALAFYKISDVLLGSTNAFVITYFLGLTILGRYNSYYCVINTLFGFFLVITNALLAGIGNSIVDETVEKNKSDFDKLNFIFNWIVGFCTICLLCLYQSFVYLLFGSENMLSISIVILLSIYFYVWKIMDVINLYKDATGMWEYDKYRPLIASIVNLILSIILVKIIGISGIIISTIFSNIIIMFPWSSYVLYKYYFKKGYSNYIKQYVINFIVTCVISIITYYITININSYSILSFVLKIIICMIIPNALYLIIYHRTKIFKETYKWLTSKLSFKSNI